MKRLIIYFLFLNLLTACESAREGFTLKKKDNSDEFLVEKKNPLVMPPNYGDLPEPKDFGSEIINKNDEVFEKIIKSSKNNDNKVDKKNAKPDEIIEELFLEWEIEVDELGGSNGISKIAQWALMRVRWTLPLTNGRKRT